MKKMTMAWAVAVILPMMSCTKGNCELDVNVSAPDSMKKKTITFTFGGDGYEQQALTRGSLSDANITDLWLFDYIGSELQQTIHQQSTDPAFGSVTLETDYGEHTLYFVASRGETPTIDGTIISWGSHLTPFGRARRSIFNRAHRLLSLSVLGASLRGYASPLPMRYLLVWPRSPSRPRIGIMV